MGKGAIEDQKLLRKSGDMEKALLCCCKAIPSQAFHFEGSLSWRKNNAPFQNKKFFVEFFWTHPATSSVQFFLIFTYTFAKFISYCFL